MGCIIPNCCMSWPLPARAKGFARNWLDETTKTRADLALFSGDSIPCLSPPVKADLSVPSTCAAMAYCAHSPLGSHFLNGLRSTVSDLSSTERGVVRATTFTFASGCLSEWMASDDAKGNTSSGMRKKPANDVSRSCSSPVKRVSSCTSTMSGKRAEATPPWVITETRKERPKSSTTSLFIPMP